MSGAEALPLGILLHGAWKAFKSTSALVKDSKHYSRERQRLRIRLVNEHRIFVTLCRQLLSEQDWDGSVDKQLEDKLNRVLGSKIELYIELAKNVCDSLVEMEKDLKIGDWERQDIKTLNRVGDAFKLSFNKPKYEKKLKELNEQNSSFRQLVEDVCQFNKKSTQQQSSAGAAASPDPPPDLTRVHVAAEKLFEVISGVLCCSNAAHKVHHLKLCIEVLNEDGILFDLAISRWTSDLKQVSSTQHATEPPTWLRIRVKNIDEGPNQDEVPPPIDHQLRDQLRDIMLTSKPTKRVRTKLQKTRRPLQGLNRNTLGSASKAIGNGTSASILQASPSGPPASSVPLTFTSFASGEVEPESKKESQDFCGYLDRIARSPDADGYVTDFDVFRLEFFASKDFADIRNQGSISLNKVVEQSDKVNLSIETKFLLAQKLSMAVLQYHSTPWLSQQWNISDIGLLDINKDQLSEKALQTLHVNTSLGHVEYDKTQSKGKEKVDALQGRGSTELILRRGVANMTIFRLGVAFLEIEYGAPLAMLREDDDEDDIYTARRLAGSTRVIISAKYRRMIDRLLRCDFGQGSDLEDSELQSAVYSEVSCVLSQMYKAVAA